LIKIFSIFHPFLPSSSLQNSKHSSPQQKEIPRARNITAQSIDPASENEKKGFHKAFKQHKRQRFRFSRDEQKYNFI